jgi:hypothetical protein
MHYLHTFMMQFFFHSYEIYTFMMSIEAPQFYIMIGGVFELFSCLDVKIITFELEQTNCCLLDYAFTFDLFEF